MRNLILLAHAISHGMALGYSVHPEKYAQVLRVIVCVLLNTGPCYPSAPGLLHWFRGNFEEHW